MQRRTAALLFALCGCTLGPDYKPPALPSGAAAPLLVGADTQQETADAPPDHWWQLYDDAALDMLIGDAFAANADLRAAQDNLSAASAVLAASRGKLYPSTGIETAAVRGRDAATDEILEIDGHPPQSIWIFDSVLEVAYEVDLFGRVRRSIEQAKADTLATAATVDALKVVVAAETARSYANVCALGEQLEVSRHSLKVVSRQADIATRRRDAGAGSDFDVVREQGLVAQVRSSIPLLEGQRRAAEYELAALIGKTPSQAPAQVLDCVAPPKLSALLPVGDGAALLKRRPDIREADRRVAAATAGIGIATADLYPRVSLTGLYGGVGSHIYELRTDAGLTWGIGPSISWSFPNQIIPRARIRQAKAQAAKAVAQFDAVVLEALKETAQALSSYAAELDHHDALVDAQQQAHKAFKLARGQLDAGSISSLDLLTTEQTLVAADAAAAASDTALVQDQIAIFKALGGGWQR
jgi:NodT family efflux transporter outer membrane factor (OMF) lipoprotein